MRNRLGASELARAVHAASGRSGRNYVVLSARDGADETVRALVRAEGGTLFVDDLEQASPEAQQVLLAAVRDQRLLHSTNPGRCNVRVLAAATPSIDQMAERGHFDADLHQTLSQLRLDIPPLRTRKREIRALADAIVRHFRDDLNRPEVRGFDSESLRVLEAYAWPGNISELIHVVEQSIVATAGTVVRAECIPAELHQRLSATASTSASENLLPNGWEIMSLKEVREAATAQIERIFLDRLLARTTGRVGETAKLAGISPRALYDRMRKHDLRKEDYKRSRGAELAVTRRR